MTQYRIVKFAHLTDWGKPRTTIYQVEKLATYGWWIFKRDYWENAVSWLESEEAAHQAIKNLEEKNRREPIQVWP